MNLPWRKPPPEDRREELPLTAMDRPIERAWMTRSRLIAVACALLVAAAAAFGYVRYGVARTFTISGDRVVIATVRRGEFLEYIPLVGVVEPRETVYLDAVDGGQVAEIMAEEGALVKAGQPLVRLNNANLQLQLINSEAQLSEQLDRLTNTKLQYEQSRLAHSRDLIEAKFHTQQSAQRLARLTALAGTGVIRRADVEDEQLELQRRQRVEAEIAQAKNLHQSLRGEEIRQLDRAVAGLNKHLELARQNLNNLVIKAPFDGQLTVLDAHLGESKQLGQRIGQIDRVDAFKITALVDEHYLPRVSVGQTVTTQIEDSTYRLALVKVYPQVRERQFKVDLMVPEGPAAGSLRRGQSLQLRLQLGGASQSLVLANGSFYDDSGGQWAFVLPPAGTPARRRPVKLGRRNLEQVEVLQGLAAGDRVIVSSYESFGDAERIELTGGAL